MEGTPQKGLVGEICLGQEAREGVVCSGQNLKNGESLGNTVENKQGLRLCQTQLEFINLRQIFGGMVSKKIDNCFHEI